jgi:hypothetical protein
MEVNLDPKMLWEDEDEFESEEPEAGQQEEPDTEVEDTDNATENNESDNAGESEDSGESEESEESEDEDETGGSESKDEGRDDEDTPKGDVFEIGGEEYTLEKLNEKFAELERGSLRQSDYTKKTQALSDSRKALDADVSFVQMIKDADLMDSIKDALEEAGVREAGITVEAVLKGNPIEHPDSIKLREMEADMKRIEEERDAEKQLEQEVQSLADSKKIPLSKANDVRKFAEELYEQKGTVLDLTDAYDLFLARKGETIIKRKQPSIPKTPKVSKGSKPVAKGEFDEWDADKLFVD